MEEYTANEEEEAIVLDRKEFWSRSYADNVILVATNITSLKGMVRRFERYLRRKGLELNVKKSKAMTFRKVGERRRKMDSRWKGEEIEEVKTISYLEYTLKENKEDDGHIKGVAGKAKAVMGRIWSIGKSLLREQWQQRMKLFDALVRSMGMKTLQRIGKNWSLFKKDT